MKRSLFLMAGLLAIVLVAPVPAKGLTATPAALHWRLRALGELAQLPVPIKIINQSKRRRTYSIKFKSPAEIGAKNEKGFKPLVRKDWLSVDSLEFSLAPGTSGGPRVFAFIPDKPENYGKKWLVYVQIKEKPPANDQFALACYPKIYLETPWTKKK